MTYGTFLAADGTEVSYKHNADTCECSECETARWATIERKQVSSVTQTTYLIETPNLIKPQVTIIGTDGNAFAVISLVRSAWRRMGRSDIATEFTARATSGDYSNVLAMAMEYVDEEAAWGSEDEEDEWNPYGDESAEEE